MVLAPHLGPVPLGAPGTGVARECPVGIVTGSATQDSDQIDATLTKPSAAV